MQVQMYDRMGKFVVGRASHASGHMEITIPGVRTLRKRIERALGHHHKQFVESSYSARYSGWDDDKAWSSQEWTTDELMDDRTEKPVVCLRARAHTFQSRFFREHKHVILEEEENHDRTVKPVVFVQRGARAQQFVFGDEHSVILGMFMFMSSTLESAVLMGKN